MKAPDYPDLILRLLIDLSALALLAWLIVVRRPRRGLIMVYSTFDVGLFAVLSVISVRHVGPAVGFGLSAMLSIIRLRSAPFTNPERRCPMRAELAGLDAFRPISLAELEATAGMLTRVDRKYVVPWAVAEQLLTALAPSHRVLEIDGRRVFSYRSVYLDSPSLGALRAHMQQRRRRYKCRTRHYVDAGLHVFEVKLKGLRGVTIKHRLPMAGAEPSGKKDVWKLFLKQYRESVPNAVGDRAKANFKAAYALAKTVVDAAKNEYARPSPYITDPSLHALNQSRFTKKFSYPSKHAVISFAEASLLSRLEPHRGPEYDWMADEIAYSRLYAGGHYPSDISAGVFLGRLIADYEAGVRR